jgi:hypothetical protein
MDYLIYTSPIYLPVLMVLIAFIFRSGFWAAKFEWKVSVGDIYGFIYAGVIIGLFIIFVHMLETYPFLCHLKGY